MTDNYNVFAGWLIDGTGGQIRENVLINVKNGKIASIKEQKEFDPKISEMDDLSHCTLLPGLIDSHVHVFMSGTSDREIRMHQLNAPFQDMKKVILKHLFQQLAHGVVAVRDGGDYSGHALRYKKEYLQSENIPICLMSAGKAWRAPGRYGKLIGRPLENGISLGQALAGEVDGVDHIKIVNSGLNSLTTFGRETRPQFSLAQLKDAVRTAENLGLKIMVHANGEFPVKLAIEAGCHTIEHGFFMGRDNLSRMAEKGTFWVPTACTMAAYAKNLDHIEAPADRSVVERTLDHQLTQLMQARERGVKTVIGTDSGSLGVVHGKSMAMELTLFMEAGYSLAEAIECATSRGAELLGLPDRGIIKQGNVASFVVCKGRPSLLPEGLSDLVTMYLDGTPVMP
jgi:imidazolonepropionase-like amidohydrolase